MKLMVCGSRTITDKDWIFKQIEDYIKELKAEDLVIIQGLAKGVDIIAKEWAENHNIKTLDFPAEWDKYGKSAGFKRNVTMVDECDCCLILWDGVSLGTKHDITLCKSKNKPHKIVSYSTK